MRTVKELVSVAVFAALLVSPFILVMMASVQQLMIFGG